MGGAASPRGEQEGKKRKKSVDGRHKAGHDDIGCDGRL
jgi:hypothetical protein